MNSVQLSALAITLRPVRISLSVAIQGHWMILAADHSSGPITVRVGLSAWERLQMAFPYLAGEDRRDAALLELEQLAGAHVDQLGADRRVVLDDAVVLAVAELRAGDNQLH